MPTSEIVKKYDNLLAKNREAYHSLKDLPEEAAINSAKLTIDQNAFLKAKESLYNQPGQGYESGCISGAFDRIKIRNKLREELRGAIRTVKNDDPANKKIIKQAYREITGRSNFNVWCDKNRLSGGSIVVCVKNTGKSLGYGVCGVIGALASAG